MRSKRYVCKAERLYSGKGLRQLFQRAAAHGVDLARRQKQPAVEVDFDMVRIKRGAAAFLQSCFQCVGGHRFFGRLGQGGAGGTYGRTACRGGEGRQSVLPDRQVKINRHVGAFFFIKMLQRGQHFAARGGDVLFGAHAEHMAAAVVVEIAARKSLPRKDRAQCVGGGGVAAAFERTPGVGYGGGHVFGAFHTAFDFKRIHAERGEGGQPVHQREILEAQIVPLGVVRRKRQTARLGAKPAVAAARAEHGAHQTLARYAHALGAVDKQLELEIGACPDCGDFVAAQLARQNGAAVAEVF